MEPITIAVIVPSAASTVCYMHIDFDPNRLETTMANLGVGLCYKKHANRNPDPVLLRNGIGSFDLPISEFDRRKAKTYGKVVTPRRLHLFESCKFAPLTIPLRKLLSAITSYAKEQVSIGNREVNLNLTLPDLCKLKDVSIGQDAMTDSSSSSVIDSQMLDSTSDPKLSQSATISAKRTSASANYSPTTPPVTSVEFYTEWILPFLYNRIVTSFKQHILLWRNIQGFYVHIPLHVLEVIRSPSVPKSVIEERFFSTNTFTIHIEIPDSFFQSSSLSHFHNGNNPIPTRPISYVNLSSEFLGNNDEYAAVNLQRFPYTLRETQNDALSSVLKVFFPSDVSLPTPVSITTITAPSTLVQLPCGSGKTILAMRIIYELFIVRQVITDAVILVPTTEILSMWLRELETVPCIASIVHVATYQGISRKNILARGGNGTSCLNPFWEKTKSFSTQLISSDREQGNTDRDDTNKIVHQVPRRTFLIVDEVHHVAAKTFHRVMTTMCPVSILAYSLGLTATMERKDGLKPLVDQVFRNSIAYERYAIEENRTLGSFMLFNLSYALTSDEAQFLLEQNSHNPHANLATVHAISTQRAKWTVNNLLPVYLFPKYNHVMILVSRVKQLSTLLDAIVNRKRECNLGYTVSIKCSSTANSSNPTFGKLLSEINTVNEFQQRGQFELHRRHVTLAVIDKVGEGFNDTSIDCLVFADRAKCPTQNASRLRSSAAGAIVYLSSPLQANGKKYAAIDIKAIRRTLFAEIKEDREYNIEIE